MLLEDYIPNVSKKYRKTFFSGISFNSTKVKKNHIFFAIRGNKIDGNNFINDAIKKGCKIIVSEKKTKKSNNEILFIHTKNIRKLLAEVSFKINVKKPKNLIAVTGTNGKSSIADFYYQILNLNNRRAASIGTLGVKSKKFKLNLLNTTIDPIQLSQILKKLKNNKVDNVIMEASSHGLNQNRLDGLKFNLGIFTNFSQDHLDYHKNLKNYLNAKLYLFKNLLKRRGIIITDATIPEFKKIKKISIHKNLNLNTINSKEKNFKILLHSFKGDAQIIKIKYKNSIKNINLNLIGKIQLKNVIMAILAAQKSNLNLEKILAVVPKLKSVEGRFEKIGKIKNKSKVVLDYAHTPDALKTCLLNLREQFSDKKISLIFGCGGDRDKDKRAKMGKVASNFSDKIYLTDDNPRSENPAKIRKDIKKGIKDNKVIEISDRKKAIFEAIKNLKSNEILLVAGKGHEKIQYVGKQKIYFSDKELILKGIKTKNLGLSNNLKLNLIKEASANKELSSTISLKKAQINSREVKKDDIFFAIKGKRVDGNKFVPEALRNKSSLAIVNRVNKNFSASKQIKVDNSLTFLSKCASIFRENISAKIISITGSCGKTTLKEMIGLTLQKLSKTTYSRFSFNNKYGVPLSLFNLKQDDNFGVFEVGMDKKGEIDNLTKIIKPDLGIITNISYAHSKNFKNIKQIADAKAEIMNNIKNNGTIVLNRDDSFYNYLKSLAHNKKLKVISFGIKNKSSLVKLTNVKKIKKNYELFFNVNGKQVSFYSKNINKSNLYNILATLASINLYLDIYTLKKDIFFNLKIPNGRGDISKIHLKNKKIFLVDETYNSNPLSLKTAIENFEQIKSKNCKKYMLLGDMLELGKHSINQHKLISKVINKTKINKVYVIGKYIKETFKGLKPYKKAKILNNKFDITSLIKKNLDNGDYLMIKGSNSTGLNRLITNFKQSRSNVI